MVLFCGNHSGKLIANTFYNQACMENEVLKNLVKKCKQSIYFDNQGLFIESDSPFTTKLAY